MILDHAGVKNVLSKRYGTRNKLVNAQATMIALSLLRVPAGGFVEEEIKVKAVNVSSGDAIPTKQETKEVRAVDMEENMEDEVMLGGLEVQEIGAEDISKEGTVKG